ncbi:mitogen-activated protein kinase 7-like isoform X2 [Watersipora subatra]
MDLMESDLHRIIYSKQSLTDEHVQYFLYQILRGLKYIHSAQVIHRDLKPSNLLVNADCELKIGDFGMARGINFKADKANQHMTQYVATRWYRAPELIVAGRQGYGPAIDIWSVGCIFAEMLRRKHLFPGRDLLNQLTVIFRTLGIPSKQYLQHLDSETVCGFIRKITESEEFKPKTCAELCPKGTSQAIDLLSKMLVIEPEKRINVETALTHPFLTKYHDKLQEPSCSKKFDFAFEQELVNLENDDQKRVGIQELLKKEVLSYRKPKPIDFGALIPSKSLDTSQTDDPYADLDAFLAQLASPAKIKTSSSTSHNALLSQVNKPSTNPLLASNKPTNSLLESNQAPNTLLAASTSNSLLATQTPPKNFLLAANASASTQKSDVQNALLQGQDTVKSHNDVTTNSQTNKRSNPLLDQADVVSFQQSCHNPLLGDCKPNQSVGAVEPSHIKTDAQSENAGNNISFMSNVIVPTTSESDQSNDTELFDSLFKKVKTEEADELTVNTLAGVSTDDIEMISAKLKQTDLAETKQEITEEKLDTKSILRQRLMDKQNTTGQAKAQDKAPGKASITAHQRQKEREERRKKKREKAQERKRNKKKEGAGQLLTSEDQKMLDRWRQMAKPQHIQPKPNSTIVSTAGKNLIVVYPATGSTTYISSNVPPNGSNANPAAAHRPTSESAYSNQQVPNNITVSKQQHVSCASNPVVSKQMQLAGGQLTTHQSVPGIMNQQINSQPNSQQSSLNQLRNSQIIASRTVCNQLPLSQPMTNKMHANQIINQTSTNQMQLPHSNINTQSSRSMQSSAVAHSVPAVNEFMNSSMPQRPSHPIRSFSDMAALHSNACQYPDQTQETSLYDYNQPTGNTVYGNNATVPLQAPEPAEPHAEHFSHWTNNTMSVNISLEMGHPEAKAEEALPPMLVSTPKGTGGGYGVGFDMESMMAYNPDLQNMHMDSAPLSASLLADWMDVTSTMDPKALDDIQRELELNDFPFSY